MLLRLQNMSRLPTGTLLLEDRLPYALGSRPRLVLERLGGAPGQHGGVHACGPRSAAATTSGPLMVRLTDPFGLCELTRSFPTRRPPHRDPAGGARCRTVRLAGEYAGSGDSRARSVAVHGEDDAATREYRHGDDLRRVHWRSTARTGELMVRREEQPWESRATVVLDTRRQGHRGRRPDRQLRVGRVRRGQHRAAPAPQRVQDPAGHRLRRRAWRAAIRAGRGPTSTPPSATARRRCWTAWPRSGPRRAPDLTALVRRVRRRGDGGLVIAVLGALTLAEAQELRRCGPAAPPAWRC